MSCFSPAHCARDMFRGFMRKRCRVPLRRSSCCSSSALCSSRRTLFTALPRRLARWYLSKTMRSCASGPSARRAQIGARHVHGHRVDAGPFLCREPVEEAAERGCRASVRDEEAACLTSLPTRVHHRRRSCSRSLESVFNIPESVFTFARNRCSRSSGIRNKAPRFRASPSGLHIGFETVYLCRSKTNARTVFRTVRASRPTPPLTVTA